MGKNSIFKFDYNIDNNLIINESNEQFLFNTIKSVDDVVLLSQVIISKNEDGTYHISGYIVDDSNRVYKTMKNYYDFNLLNTSKEYNRFNYVCINSENIVKFSY